MSAKYVKNVFISFLEMSSLRFSGTTLVLVNANFYMYYLMT